MTFKRTILAAAALAVIAAPAAALADPAWGGGDREQHQGWGGQRDGGDGRDGWRGEGRGEHHGWRGYDRGDYEGGWRGGYARAYYPRCGWRTQGYHNWFGQYEYRQVRVCR